MSQYAMADKMYGETGGNSSGADPFSMKQRISSVQIR
jgi:hypothetical protein